MEVCFDLSAAAQARATPDGGTTGVPRVVENLLRRLVVSEKCNVSLCAPTSPLEGWEYYRSDFAGSTPAYLHDRVSTPLGRALRKVNAYATRHRQKRRPSDRAMRYLLHHVAAPYLGRLSRRGLEGTDIYHSPHGAIPAEVRRNRRLKVFLTVYDLIPFRRPEFFVPGMAEAQRRIMRTTRPEEDRFLCISEHTKQDLCALFPVDPARVFVTPLAAAPGTFYPCRDEEWRRDIRRRYGLPEQSPYVLSVCTLEPRKNLRAVLGAFRALLTQERPRDLRLVLVGGKGWLDGPLMEDLARLGEWRDRVHLLGYVPDADLSALYGGALCFAYMSFYEGFGLPPLEAMQCGVPVITSNASSLPEVVGDAGICLEPTDVAGLADAIWRLHESAELHASMAARSLARARMFSWRRCLDATLAAYATP